MTDLTPFKPRPRRITLAPIDSDLTRHTDAIRRALSHTPRTACELGRIANLSASRAYAVLQSMVVQGAAVRDPSDSPSQGPVRYALLVPPRGVRGTDVPGDTYRAQIDRMVTLQGRLRARQASANWTDVAKLARALDMLETLT